MPVRERVNSINFLKTLTIYVSSNLLLKATKGSIIRCKVYENWCPVVKEDSAISKFKSQKLKIKVKWYFTQF